MGELTPNHYLADPAIEKRYQAFRAELEEQSKPGYDPYARAFSQCFSRILGEDSEIANHQRTLATTRPHYSPDYMLNVNLRAVQTTALKLHSEAYPAGFERPERWTESIRETFSDTHFPSWYMNVNRGLMTNKAERGKLLKAVLLLNDRADSASILDVGCSQNHVLKKLDIHHPRNFPYGPTKIAGPENTTPARKLSAALKLKYLLGHGSLSLGPSVGVDIFNLSDPIVRDWARSCSFYPSELVDKRGPNDFNALSDQETPNVAFKRVDFTTKMANEEFVKVLPERFDVVYYSTILNALPSQDLAQALANGERAVKKDGLVVVQDFVDVNEAGNMSFYPIRANAGDWKYSAWVKDMSQPEQGFQKYFTADGGRVQAIKIEAAAGRLVTAASFRALRPDLPRLRIAS